MVHTAVEKDLVWAGIVTAEFKDADRCEMIPNVTSTSRPIGQIGRLVWFEAINIWPIDRRRPGRRQEHA